MNHTKTKRFSLVIFLVFALVLAFMVSSCNQGNKIKKDDIENHIWVVAHANPQEYFYFFSKDSIVYDWLYETNTSVEQEYLTPIGTPELNPFPEWETSKPYKAGWVPMTQYKIEGNTITMKEEDGTFRIQFIIESITDSLVEGMECEVLHLKQHDKNIVWIEAEYLEHENYGFDDD